MPKQVKLPNGKFGNFPDYMSWDDVESVVKKQFPPTGTQASNDSSAQPQQPENSLFGSQFSTPNQSLAQSITDEHTPLDFAKDIGIGLGNTGQGIASILTGGYAPKVDMNQVFNAQHPSEFVQNIAGYAPFGLAGGASLAGQLAAGAGYGATNTNPDEQNAGGLLPNGRLGGSIEGALVNLLTHGVVKGAEALRPSNMFKSQLSPQELQRNLDITKGTETGLGDVIGSPFLKRRLENTLTSVPFSGANEALQRTGADVVNKGESLLSNLLGDQSSENVPEAITKGLQGEYKKALIQKNALYDNFNNEADKQFLNLPLKNFSDKAKEYKDLIESTNILKQEPDIKRILTKLGIYENPVVKVPGNNALVSPSGQPLVGQPLNTHILPTAKEANLLKGKLNDYAAQYRISSEPSNRYAAGVFGDLSKALKQDINSAIDQSGNPNLRQAYDVAEKNYATNYKPFLDKKIYKYINGQGDPENIIRDFIKTSPNVDLANHLGKLSTKIPGSKQPLLAYAYLARSLDNEGNFNPAKFGTAVKKLGPNQLKTLLPDPALRKQVLDYNKLQNMNKDAQYLMFNPKTGQRLSDATVTGLLGILGQKMSGLLGTAALGGTPILAGKAMTKYLTSPAVREALVKKMLADKPLFDKPGVTQGAQTLTQGLVNLLSQGNKT